MVRKLSTISDKKFVIQAGRMALDNLLCHQIIIEMTNFIAETGALSFSTQKRAQDKYVRNYFKTAAIKKLEAKGLNFGVGNPWGIDFMNLEDVNHFDPLEDEFENEEDGFEEN